MKVWRSRSKVCTRLQKSRSTMPVMDRWYHWMDWDEDQWSGYSSGRSWSLERDTTCGQPFLWRMALNDDDSWMMAVTKIGSTGDAHDATPTHQEPLYQINRTTLCNAMITNHGSSCKKINSKNSPLPLQCQVPSLKHKHNGQMKHEYTFTTHPEPTY